MDVGDMDHMAVKEVCSKTIPEFQRTHYASCSDEFSILKSFSRNCLKTVGDDVLSEIREE